MKTLLQIRKKTGLSQYDMADYLGVSRSMVNMAEKGLRELPNQAWLKLMDMHKIITGGAAGNTSTTVTVDDMVLKKAKHYHTRKMQHHLLEAKKLQIRQAKMIHAQQPASIKQKVVDGLLKNIPQRRRTSVDEKWLDYHDELNRQKMVKNAVALQMLAINIKIHTGYAAVHEKILKELS